MGRASLAIVCCIHHAGEVNVDHRQLHEAVVMACRSASGYVVIRLDSLKMVINTKLRLPVTSPAFQPN
jgi:hypothetical protein